MKIPNPLGTLDCNCDARETGAAFSVTARAVAPHRSGLAVLGCILVGWTLRALEPLDACVVACHWTAGFDSGAPECGQDVDALAWTIGDIEVRLGTNDVEALIARALDGDAMPARLATVFDPEAPTDVVAFLSDGLAICIPPLQAGEAISGHFALAWADRAHDYDAWAAVDWSFAEVRQRLEAPPDDA